MVTVLKIRNLQDIEYTIRALKGIHKKLPLMTSKSMMKWGKILERDMKMSAKKADIKRYTGGLLDTGIQWRQRPKGKIGRLFIRQYGVWLDSMKTHVVLVKPSRTRLLKWAKQANNPIIRKQAKNINKIGHFPLVVRKHPYIRAGWNRSRPKLRPILKQELRKVMRGI